MKADDSSMVKAACVGIALNGGAIYQPIRYIKRGGVNLGVILVVGLAYGITDTPGGISLISERGSGDFDTLLGFATTATRLEVNIDTAEEAIA